MYFASELQEQDVKVISKIMKKSKVCSTLKTPMSISYPGLTCNTFRSFVPTVLQLFLRHQFFTNCDANYTIIWKLIYVQLQNMYKQRAPVGTLWGPHDSSGDEESWSGSLGAYVMALLLLKRKARTATCAYVQKGIGPSRSIACPVLPSCVEKGNITKKLQGRN